MNERIKELAEQAALLGPSSRVGNAHEATEKFAELIVKECSKVIVNGGYRNPALGEKHPLTPPEIATMIKEHFGVEE
jgi:hypothetical protein